MRAFTVLRFLFACGWLADICLCNDPPIVSFGPGSGHVIFNEDEPLGTQLFQIVATDLDSSTVSIEADAGNQETVNLVNVTSARRSGSTWTSNVTLAGRLDRDRNPNQRTLVFIVKDESSTLTGRVVLIIRDVNDNPPEFVDLPYRCTLKENAVVGRSVYKATAEDRDDGPGGSVKYSMAAQAQGADDEYNTTFVIDLNNGTIKLSRELDYEIRNYYQFLVYAQDNGSPACPGPSCKCNNITEPSVKCDGEPAVFAVTVEDVQDSPPFFVNLPYIDYVDEDALLGESIYTVTALDGDRGVPNEVTYSIVADPSAGPYPFSINETTGDISVNATLDADVSTGRSYTLIIMATEVGKQGQVQLGETSATTKMSISVLDVNDNAPDFKEDNYKATVQENTPTGVPISLEVPIEVTDRDQNDNSRFRLSVTKDGQPYYVFSTLPRADEDVLGTTTVIIRVNESSELDYETVKTITFQVEATENGTAETFTSNTTVTVTLEDMNDNTPKFLDNQSREVNVTEHARNDTVLATFTATDADSGDFGLVNYSLEDGMGKFDIDNATGKLYVTGDIDREDRTSYSLVVVATDNMAGLETNQRSARLSIRVTVLDINDNPPKFGGHPPVVTVQENAENGTALMTLTATDKDEGDNGKIVYDVYSIISSGRQAPDYLFAIGDHGEVFVNVSLVGYSGFHNVTFVAYDSAPDPLNGTTMLTIEVRDVNMNTPVFVSPNESTVNTSLGIIPIVEVREQEPLESLIYVLSATDEDTGKNGEVLYYLEPDVNQNWQYFKVDRISGNLTNQRELDYETHKSFLINIKAQDEGSPTQLSKTIPINVNLIDIDDNEPYFPSRELYLKAQEKSVGNVSILEAKDKDTDSNNTIMCYYLYGGEQLSSFSLAKTGELNLTSKLDREVTPTVRIIVKVSADCSLPEDYFYASNSNNSFNNSDDSQMRVVLTVIDINDNPPVLQKSELTTGLLYSEDVGTVVFDLKKVTTDGDTPENSQNMYLLNGSITGSDDLPPDLLNPVPFEVTINGSVLTKRLFKADTRGHFILPIEVHDKEHPPDRGNLMIYLVSELMRIKLVVEKLPDEAYRDKGNLTQELGNVLGFKVIIDKITTHITNTGQPDPTMSDVYIHARRPNGEVVPTTELENLFDYTVDVRPIFSRYRILRAVSPLPPEEKEDNSLMRAFIIVAVVLGIVCLILVVVLINTIRRYHRRLRAATTSAYVSEKQAPDVYVPPGTNKYFAAENPLFGKDMKVIDVDRLSNDSLDDNAVGGAKSGDEKEAEEEQEMYMQIFDEQQQSPGSHPNHLEMVLHEYDKGVSGPHEGSTPSSPSVGGAGMGNNWTTKNGHVKSDSGFNEQGALEHHDDEYQYTDI